MEASKTSAGFLLLLGVLVGLVPSSDAYVFYVGGRDGWVLKPSEDYARWSGRNRFQVNDTLVFKYKSGEDSVLEVKEDDYNSCKLDHPIQRMDGGNSMLKFDRSGPFYFISGTGDRCQKGQKVTIVVMAVRKNTGQPPSSPAPTPSHQPPTSSPAPPPSTHAPSPAQSPSTHVPSPSPASSSTSPASSPASPPSSSPPKAPSPSTASPASSPASDQRTAPAPSPTANHSSSSSVLSGSGVAFAAMALVLGVAFMN